MRALTSHSGGPREGGGAAGGPWGEWVPGRRRADLQTSLNRVGKVQKVGVRRATGGSWEGWSQEGEGRAPGPSLPCGRRGSAPVILFWCGRCVRWKASLTGSGSFSAPMAAGPGRDKPRPLRGAGARRNVKSTKSPQDRVSPQLSPQVGITA